MLVLLWWYFVVFVDEGPSKIVQDCRLRSTDFQILKVIGRGAFGEVQLVRTAVYFYLLSELILSLLLLTCYWGLRPLSNSLITGFCSLFIIPLALCNKFLMWLAYCFSLFCLRWLTMCLHFTITVCLSIVLHTSGSAEAFQKGVRHETIEQVWNGELIFSFFCHIISTSHLPKVI